MQRVPGTLSWPTNSVDPSERRTERTFGSTGPGRAKLERAGVHLDHFGEEIRFENDSVLLAMAGIIATRAESVEAALATGSVSQAYTVIFWMCFLRKAALEPRFMCKPS